LKLRAGIPALCVLTLLLGSCATRESPEALGMPATTSVLPTHPAPPTQSSKPTGSSLFLEAGVTTAPPTGMEIARARWVKIESTLLLDAQGKPLKLPPSTEITLNLFPDTTYTGVIEQVQQEGGGYAWVGHLKGVDNSTVLIVYTAGVFMGHFASPRGVYEVSNAGGDLYRVIQIDQSKLPGGEGNSYIFADTIQLRDQHSHSKFIN